MVKVFQKSVEIVVLLIYLYFVIIETSTYTSQSYIVESNTSITIIPANIDYYNVGVFFCGVTCLGMKSSCNCFLYNPITLQCSLGSTIKPTGGVARNVTSSVLYTRFKCNFSQGFRLVTNNITSACVWFSTQNLLFPNATDICARKSSYLFTPRDRIKLGLLIMLNVSYLVGLNDIDQENVFIWSDDGSVLDNVTRKSIFYSGQPDNNPPGEDCVHYYRNSFGCNDLQCTIVMPFLCEWSMIIV